MNGISCAGLTQLSAATLCCLGCVLPVMAAPPTTRLQNAMQTAPRPASANASLPAHLEVPAHLDLRPPSPSEFGLAASGDSETRRFPSARGLQEDRGSSANDLPSLGGEAEVHPLGLAQGIAQRFHREGLPVARLWENHSALVSLGLNQKGKPGLWLVQKTH